MEFERRFLPEGEAEVRFAAGRRSFHGYAAVYDRWSEELGTGAFAFRERIAPGFFDAVLEQGPDIPLLLNHEARDLLARTGAATLELDSNKRGLKTHAPELPNTSLGNDVAVLLERRDLSAMSFGFRAKVDEWSKDGRKRTLIEAERVRDVSIVTFPAYRQTQAELRAEDLRFESALRHARAGEIDPDELRLLEELVGEARAARSPSRLRRRLELRERLAGF